MFLFTHFLANESFKGLHWLFPMTG